MSKKKEYERPELWRLYPVERSDTLRVQRPTVDNDQHLAIVRVGVGQVRIEAEEVRGLIVALIHAGGDLCA